MFEKVNPAHPDKVADRIAGAMVDYAYSVDENPKVAVEVLIGHGQCYVIAETTVNYTVRWLEQTVERISGKKHEVMLVSVPQDKILAGNQNGKTRCGDNGIFRGMPSTREQKDLSDLAKFLYKKYGTDGKYVLDGKRLIICQSNATADEILETFKGATVNPLGYWTGGTDVDTGATNRKLGSDMGDAVTGGGLHGKDLSKADVSVNIYAHVKAALTGKEVNLCCAIGDEYIDGIPYQDIVAIARTFIRARGGFERFAEWGLI